MCGTELAYGATRCAVLRCYAMCGTELAYGATSIESYPLAFCDSTSMDDARDLVCHAPDLLRAVRSVCYALSGICLRACYALSGIGLVYAACDVRP
eukprot:809936-Rhodomonas_salina.3